MMHDSQHKPPRRKLKALVGATAAAATLLGTAITALVSASPAGAGTGAVTALGPIAPQATDNSSYTGTGAAGDTITSETSTNDYNYVYLPTNTTNSKQQQDTLALFLGGAGSQPSDYTSISQDAATDGFGVIDLRYNSTTNLITTGASCALSLTNKLKDQCFTNERGETVFGNSYPYAPNWPSYSSLGVSVTPANSVVNRLVNQIDYLATNDPSRSSYWSQFLVPNASSPYKTVHFGAVYPNWSQIVVAGHSDGGGMAAFIGSHIPVRGVIMLSSPDDNVSGVSASWITASSATPLNHYWGMANQSDLEGDLSSAVLQNWADFAGHGIGYPTDTSTVQIADGSGDSSGSYEGSHQLITTTPTCSTSLALVCHNSTAVNPSSPNPDLTKAWDYLFNSAAAG